MELGFLASLLSMTVLFQSVLAMKHERERKNPYLYLSSLLRV